MSPTTAAAAVVPLPILDVQLLWGGVAFGALFLLAWLAGVAMLINSLVRRARGVRTAGEIVGWDHTGDSSNPIVQWDANDRTYRRTVMMGNFGWYPTKKVVVWYDPDNPERITTQLFAWAPNGLGWTLFTLPFGAIGLLIISMCAKALLT